MNSAGNPWRSHPDEGDLLRFADAEMPPAEAARMQAHLEACPECRAQLDALSATIREFAHYRNSLYQRCFPSPPAPWCDLHQRMAALRATPGSNSFQEKVWSLWGNAFTGWTAPRRWAPVLATLLLLAFAVDQFRNAPSVRASALLEKAAAAADSRAPKARRLQFRTRSLQLTRVIGEPAQTGRPVALVAAEQQLAELFARARYDWNDPLSARAFRSWRGQLPSKTDSVREVPAAAGSPDGDCFEIQTQTASGELHRATLKLRQSDWMPVQATLEFRNEEQVEIREVESVPAGPLGSAAAVAEPRAPGAANPVPRTGPGEDAGSAATVSDELEVLAALRRLNADLGEPVEVEREAGGIVVRGLGVSPELERRLRRELESFPRVTLELAVPDPAAVTAPDYRGGSGQLIPPEVARWREQLEKRLGGRTALDQAGEELIDVTDQAMARIYALRRLAQRFSVAEEARLSAEDRNRLHELRADHALALSNHVAALERRLPGMLQSLLAGEVAAVAVVPAGAWQTAAAAALPCGRQLESGLAMLFGSAPVNPSSTLPQEMLRALAELKVHAQTLLQP